MNINNLRMKKVWFLLLAMVWGAGVQAQIVSSRSVSVRSTPSHPTEIQWFLRGGLNVMGFAGDGAENLDKKLGYNLMYGFQRPVGSIGTYWGMEFGLGSRGYKFEVDGTEINLMAHAVEVSPFTFGWKYGLTEAVKVDVHLGVFAHADYTGKAKFKNKKQEKSVGMGDWEDELHVDWNRFDVGLNAGFGVWYDRFNLDFTYQRGFVEAPKDSEMYTSNLLIRLGVAF